MTARHRATEAAGADELTRCHAVIETYGRYTAGRTVLDLTRQARATQPVLDEIAAIGTFSATVVELMAFFGGTCRATHELDAPPVLDPRAC